MRGRRDGERTSPGARAQDIPPGFLPAGVSDVLDEFDKSAAVAPFLEQVFESSWRASRFMRA